MHCYNEMAEVYDNLIYKDINYKKWADMIIQLCKDNNISMNDYLDLACGTGNLTYELCDKFKRVWAVDLSSEMLTRAEEKLHEKFINTKFVCQDICDLQLNRKYDLITCCLDSTNYILDENDFFKYLTGVYNHLNENGIFIFDINSEYKLKEILGDNTYTYDDDEIVYIWENCLENNIVEMYLTFFVKNGQVYNRFDEMHTEKIYTDTEIQEALFKVGFEVINTFDNYENKKVSEHSERIVYIVKKK